jgi:NifU-like protein
VTRHLSPNAFGDGSCQNLTVSFYPSKVQERFLSPANVAGEDFGTKGIAASFICGTFIELFVAIEDDGIEKAKFRTNGCGFMVAAADVLCEWLSGKQLAKLHGLNDDELCIVVTEALGKFPANRMQCASAAFDALHKAMSNYREARIAEYEGEKALICTCFGISEDTIVATITEKKLTEVEDVADHVRAGSGCGSCRMLIQELIDAEKAARI